MYLSYYIFLVTSLLSPRHVVSGVDPAAAERIVTYLKHLSSSTSSSSSSSSSSAASASSSTTTTTTTTNSNTENEVEEEGHQSVPPPQALLFASHRIEECVSTCTRVILLVEGCVYFDGSVLAFNELARLTIHITPIHPTIHQPTANPNPNHPPTSLCFYFV